MCEANAIPVIPFIAHLGQSFQVWRSVSGGKRVDSSPCRLLMGILAIPMHLRQLWIAERVHVQTGGRSCVDDMEIISCCTAADTGADDATGQYLR